MATPKISTQASTPTFPTGAAQCDRLLRVNDIRELTGWSENTARKFMRESVSVNIFFTIFTNVFSPIAPTRMRRIRQRGCAAFGV